MGHRRKSPTTGRYIHLSNTQLEAEKWKPIRGFEDTYEISNFGRVRRILVTRIQNGGYLFFPLYRSRKAVYRTIHSMVAEAFIGPRPLGYDVHHKDADKTNNAETNLEYVTRSENLKHAWRSGAFQSRKGKSKWRLTAKQVREIRSSGEPGYKLAEKFEVSQAIVSNVRTKTSYRWVR